MKLFFKFKVLPYLVYLLVKFIYATNKKVYHHPKLDENEAFVFVSWHGDLLGQPINYKALRKNRELKAIISQSKDGEMISKAFSFLGIKGIRGSSSKGAAKALISTIKEIKSGSDVAVTPDGPRGPRHAVANGAIVAAQKGNARVIVLNTIPSRYWQFNSWDKFVMPKPFGKIDFYVSEPYDISHMELEEAKEFIKEKMMIHTMD